MCATPSSGHTKLPRFSVDTRSCPCQLRFSQTAVTRQLHASHMPIARGGRGGAQEGGHRGMARGNTKNTPHTTHTPLKHTKRYTPHALGKTRVGGYMYEALDGVGGYMYEALDGVGGYMHEAHRFAEKDMATPACTHELEIQPHIQRFRTARPHERLAFCEGLRHHLLIPRRHLSP